MRVGYMETVRRGGDRLLGLFAGNSTPWPTLLVGFLPKEPSELAGYLRAMTTIQGSPCFGFELPTH